MRRTTVLIIASLCILTSAHPDDYWNRQSGDEVQERAITDSDSDQQSLSLSDDKTSRRQRRPAAELVRPLWMTHAARETWRALNRNADMERRKAKEKKHRQQRLFLKRMNRMLKKVGGSKETFTREEMKHEIRMFSQRLFGRMYPVLAANFHPED